MARLDPHSYCDSIQPEVRRLEWTALVDFATRRLVCEATLHLEGAGAGPLDLDTRGLEIEAVEDGSGRALTFLLSPAEPVLGSRLRVTLTAGTDAITVRYRTSPDASALQWLEPAMTEGGKHPFLFSQCQAVHARSLVPVQDSPRIRIRFKARLTVPRELRVLVAAEFLSREESATHATETYEMPQPVPPYLLAFAVGNLKSRDLGPRSRVWAEPERLEAAAWEFAGVDGMLTAAESLFGPYDWDRFDLLTMPPSFPYGGMENPRLTFLTPTLLAGDRSLVNVVAHELAHSWTGNLVTNASAEHFWLNEGFTVYAERRILEALEGREREELHAALGRRHLERAVAQFAAAPELTKLRTSLTGVDPDEAFSQVPYEKGYLLLRAIEEDVGRPAFDAYLKSYLETHRFGALTTEDWEAFTEAKLPGALGRVGADTYLHAAGIPAAAPRAQSALLDQVEKVGSRVPTEAEAHAWTPTEWQLYLERLPVQVSLSLVRDLEARFHLEAMRNSDVRVAWLITGLRAGHAPATAGTEKLLGEVGRMKYLKPLYAQLASSPRTRGVAEACLERNRGRYHPIARAGVEHILRAARPA